jgi:hypothetical protein
LLALHRRVIRLRVASHLHPPIDLAHDEMDVDLHHAGELLHEQRIGVVRRRQPASEMRDQRGNLATCDIAIGRLGDRHKV